MLEKHGVKIWYTTRKYQHMHMAFIKALNKLLTEILFKVQDEQELNDPEKVLSTWVKHLYGLIDRLNDKEMQMTGMKPKEAIELKGVPLEKVIPQKTHCLRMACIVTYYNPVKSTMTSAREPWIEYGLKRLTD